VFVSAYKDSLKRMWCLTFLTAALVFGLNRPDDQDMVSTFEQMLILNSTQHRRHSFDVFSAAAMIGSRKLLRCCVSVCLLVGVCFYLPSCAPGTVDMVYVLLLLRSHAWLFFTGTDMKNIMIDEDNESRGTQSMQERIIQSSESPSSCAVTAVCIDCDVLQACIRLKGAMQRSS